MYIDSLLSDYGHATITGNSDFLLYQILALMLVVLLHLCHGLDLTIAPNSGRHEGKLILRCNCTVRLQHIIFELFAEQAAVI